MSWLAWLAHAAIVKDGPLLLAATLGLTASLGLVVVFFRLGALPRPRQLAVMFGGYATVIGFLLVDPMFGSIAPAALDLAWFSPQLVSAYRNLDLSGISVRAYV